MATNVPALSALVKATPEAALAKLETDVQQSIASLESVKPIENLKQMQKASEALDIGVFTWGRMEGFRTQLAEAVSNAAKALIHFEGFDVKIQVTWPDRTRLSNAIEATRTKRAQFLRNEEERARREQAARDAEQNEKNRKAAEEAAKAAKKAGADKETVAEIKRDVMDTPAPMVTNIAVERAKEAGVSVRYNYTAKLEDPIRFFQYAVTNDVMLVTLCNDAKVKEAIEKCFTPLAKAQREAFKYPGLIWNKEAVDVARRSR